jgi:integrase
MASVRKISDSPYWIACFTLPDGKRTNRSTKSKDKREAQRIALEWETASRAAQKGNLIESQARKVVGNILEIVGAGTIKSESVTVFLDQWAEGKNNQATSDRYKQIVEHFKGYIGSKTNGMLTAISYKDILGFIEHRKRAGVAPKTASVEVKILNTAFNLARRLTLIPENPVEKALALKPIKVESSEKENFTLEQIRKLFKSASGDWLTAIYLGFYTGARLTDCANMEWANVNFDEGVVDFLPKKTRRNSKRVVVPFHPDLDQHLQEIAPDRPVIFICPALAGKMTGGEHGLSKSFKSIMEKAGIDAQLVEGKGNRKFSKLSFHSLRHSFNSILANKGVNQETRMSFTGHSSTEINDDYTKLDLPTLKSAISKLPSMR